MVSLAAGPQDVICFKHYVAYFCIFCQVDEEFVEGSPFLTKFQAIGNRIMFIRKVKLVLFTLDQYEQHYSSDVKPRV